MDFTQHPNGLLIPKEKPVPKENPSPRYSFHYQSAHAECPQCGGKSICQTTGPTREDRDTNRAMCDTCDWRGIVHDKVAATDWHEFNGRIQREGGLFWVRCGDGESLLAEWIEHSKEWPPPELVNDDNDRIIENVTHWADIKPKKFP